MIELLIGFGWIALYFACAATIALLCRLFIKIPDEVFRKILHTIMLFSMTRCGIKTFVEHFKNKDNSNAS